MIDVLISALVILGVALIFIGVPYLLISQAKDRGGKGCAIGGYAGLALFFALVAISNDAPEMGGIFVIPFFIAFGGLLGWIIGKLMGKPKA